MAIKRTLDAPKDVSLPAAELRTLEAWFADRVGGMGRKSDAGMLANR